MESRKLDQEPPQITAQPRQLADELMARPIAESGLSVEPEEMGAQFLSGAMEQDNFESFQGGDTPDMYINNPSPSDAALTGSNWEQEKSVWQHTVEASLQSGSLDEARAQGSPQGADLGLEDQAAIEQDPEDVDIVASNIRGASLFDHEGKSPGEVRSPLIETDEMAVSARRHDAAMRDLASAERRTSGQSMADRPGRRGGRGGLDGV